MIKLSTNKFIANTLKLKKELKHSFTKGQTRRKQLVINNKILAKQATNIIVQKGTTTLHKFTYALHSLVITFGPCLNKRQMLAQVQEDHLS